MSLEDEWIDFSEKVVPFIPPELTDVARVIFYAGAVAHLKAQRVATEQLRKEIAGVSAYCGARAKEEDSL